MGAGTVAKGVRVRFQRGRECAQKIGYFCVKDRLSTSYIYFLLAEQRVNNLLDRRSTTKFSGWTAVLANSLRDIGAAHRFGASRRDLRLGRAGAPARSRCQSLAWIARGHQENPGRVWRRRSLARG